MSPRSAFLRTALIFSLPLAALGAARPALAIDLPTPVTAACDTSDIRSVVDRGSGLTTPCVVGEHRLVVETGYFQNASAEGGTALAAYPLAQIRYGLSARTELLLDPATAIAKSGLNGQGIYTWSRSGAGLTYEFTDTARSAFSAHFIYTPLPDETTALSTRESDDIGVRDRIVFNDRFSLGLSMGDIIYIQGGVQDNHQSSLYGRVSLNERLSNHLQFGVLAGRVAKITAHATPQTNVSLAVLDSFTPFALGDFEIGDALNPSGGTKAHYIGFGISFMH